MMCTVGRLEVMIMAIMYIHGCWEDCWKKQMRSRLQAVKAEQEKTMTQEKEEQ